MHLSIRRDVIANLVRTITVSVLSFITFPYICRILITSSEPGALFGVNTLGLYTWITSFIYFFSVFARIGIPNIAIRECAKVKHDKTLLSHKAQEFFTLQGITTIISFGALIALTFSIPGDFRNNMNLILLLAVNFVAGVLAFEWVFIALEKQTYMALRSIIILAFTSIMIVLFVTVPEHVYLYTFFIILGTLLTVISNLIYLPRLISLKKTMPYNFRQYFPALGILLLITLLLTIYNNSDTLIMGLVNPNKNEVANYALGIRGIDLVIGILTSLSGVFLPRTAYYYAQGQKEAYQNTLKYSTNIYLFIAIPAIVLMSVLAIPITTVLSGENIQGINQIGSNNAYAEAPILIIVLALMMLTYSLADLIYTQVLIPMKKERIYAEAIGIGIAVNITLCLLLSLLAFKDQPAIGIAIAVIASDLVLLTYLLIRTRTTILPSIRHKNNLKVLIAGLVMIAVALGAYFLFDFVFNSYAPNINLVISSLILIAIVGVLSGMGYIFTAFLLKENLISSIFRRKKASQ